MNRLQKIIGNWDAEHCIKPEDIEWLIIQCKNQMESLEFYAETENYIPKFGDVSSKIKKDYGQMAIKALKGVKQ